MNHVQAFFLIGIVGLVAGDCSASAQTFEPGTKQVSEQSTIAEKPSAVSKFKVWTRARWEAARKHWAQDNAKFYACNHKWRQQMADENIPSMISVSFFFIA
jgi:predicted transposase YbfD/YdcC